MGRWFSRLAAFSAVLGSLGCGPSEGSEPLAGSSAWPIIDGELDDAHPSVGIVEIVAPAGVCTGTLVAEDRVVTAAHCIYAVTASDAYVDEAVFLLGDEPRLQRRAIAAAAHPEFLGVRDWDLGVLWLAQPVDTVAPARLASSARSMGEQIAVVGYGDTSYSEGGFGTKRVGLQTIADLDPLWFGFEGTPAICHGDSGGPSFVSEEQGEAIAGVHSGSSQQCVGWGYDMRVDTFRDWIAQAEPAVGFYRARCDLGYPCRSGICLTADDGNAYCSQGCEEMVCPYGDACVDHPDGGDPPRICQPHSGGDGALGDPCNVLTDCLLGDCVDLGPELDMRCSTACSLDAPACPSGFACAEVESGSFCAPDSGAGGGASAATVGGSDGGDGCAVGPRPRCSAPWGALLGLLATGSVLARRRRAQR